MKIAQGREARNGGILSQAQFGSAVSVNGSLAYAYLKII
jgi:hypothetical protein